MLSKTYLSTWLSVDSESGGVGMEVCKFPSAILYLTLTLSCNDFLPTLPPPLLTKTYLVFHFKSFHLYKDFNDSPPSIQLHSFSHQYFWALNNNLHLCVAHYVPGTVINTLFIITN